MLDYVLMFCLGVVSLYVLEKFIERVSGRVADDTVSHLWDRVSDLKKKVNGERRFRLNFKR